MVLAEKLVTPAAAEAAASSQHGAATFCGGPCYLWLLVGFLPSRGVHKRTRGENEQMYI
eukprot:CAMPEP_0183312558 /NCGR_PEP_ID=MMETSP0160_2-20130417/42072_1 /TAXON_ID=2839 ORGANISM="Odontella Sinensis, Strain Grunow 1884" /NCGR_SAMPLE_ID=MMETSP0160_2 /ASSEMBLY_ACC=CAM_ASM_000250 /LENGTH=58 /DNA_ID=CAMNT_0025477429 /DNA_START=168 /DNA_END=344 /DNA_ORIENTATION=+